MESILQKSNFEPYFMFSTVTFRAHLFIPPCPLLVVFPNDTNIWLWSVLSLVLPSLCARLVTIFSGASSSTICSCWYLSVIRCVIWISFSSGREGRGERSPSTYSLFSRRQKRKGKKLSFHLPDRNQMLFSFRILFLTLTEQFTDCDSKYACSEQIKVSQTLLKIVGVDAVKRKVWRFWYISLKEGLLISLWTATV